MLDDKTAKPDCPVMLYNVACKIYNEVCYYLYSL